MTDAREIAEGHDPATCRNCSPITGACILGCERWNGECRKSAAIAYQAWEERRVANVLAVRAELARMERPDAGGGR